MIYAHPKVGSRKGALFKNLSLMILIGLVIFSAYQTNQKQEPMKVMAYGPSMEPTIQDKQIINVYPITEELKIGDIIVFNNGIKELPIVHRIIFILEEQGETYYVTKGDNMQNFDRTIIHKNNIIGVVKNG